MRVPVSWLRDYVDVPADATGAQVAASLVRMGLEEEALHGGDIEGPLVVGRVLEVTPEQQKNGKTINWCRVDVGQHGQRVTDGTPQGIVCGAHNFAAGDLVVVVLPGAVLPGGIPISARKTYGHVSAGMICSAAELGLGDDGSGGIVVLGELLGEAEAEQLQPGDDAVELLGLADETVEVTITPDRGYCFSMRGVAREYSHATGAAFRDPADRSVPSPDDQGYAVRLADEAPFRGRPGCDRYVARTVRGVDASVRSPRWMAKRLTEAGMRPISLAVDVTNYVMLALGQPLHAFDLDQLSGQIVVRRARAGERLRTLDDVDRELDPEDLLITDGGEVPLAIAGVMGGETSEVSSSTTSVLIESAHFDSTTVARSSRRHRLSTEASRRYERGVDPDVSAAAAQWAAELLVRHGGGRIDDGVTDVDHRAPREPVLFDPALAGELVGIAYPREEVVSSLKALGCEVSEAPAPADDTKSGEGRLSVLPPPWRPDLVDGPDLVEEVARLHGYDAIPSVLPEAPGGRGLTHGQRVRRTVADALAGAGLVEVVTYPFVSAALFDQLGLPADDVRRQAVRLANPLSEEAPLMRTSVVSTLLEALRRNVARGMKDVALFEVGLVSLPGGPVATAPVPGVEGRPDGGTLEAILTAVPHQPRHVGLALSGLVEHKGWWGPGRPAQWSDAVAAVRRLATGLSLELAVEAAELAPWHPGRCARLALPDGTEVGHAGELHPKVLAALGLPARTCAAEVDLDALIAASAQPVQARAIATSPPAHSDVALVVPQQVPASAVERALRAGAGDLLEVVALFDVYEGDQVAKGHRSLAYRLTFRAPGRTLTTEEVNELRDRAVAEAASRTGAELRGN